MPLKDYWQNSKKRNSVTSTVEELLIKKGKIIATVYKLTIKQNDCLKKGDTKKVLLYDKRKTALLKLLVTIESSILNSSSKNQRYLENAGNIVKNINLLFNDLIKAEKENEILVSQYVDMYSGKHIDEYKRIKRQATTWK